MVGGMVEGEDTGEVHLLMEEHQHQFPPLEPLPRLTMWTAFLAAGIPSLYSSDLFAKESDTC